MQCIALSVRFLWTAVLFFSLISTRSFAASHITAVWANDGGDKVTKDELRVTQHKENQTGLTRNRVWDGNKIHLFGARNEIVTFNLVLEAGGLQPASRVRITFDRLARADGAEIKSAQVTADHVFDWTNRPIELFLARYLKIRGLSYFGYGKWDERQIPVRMQRPHLDNGQPFGEGGWYDRPDHDKLYPDPLVPMETIGAFDIPSGENQSVWCDIYIPKSTGGGVYEGVAEIQESDEVTRTVPIQLTVYDFQLPDVSSAKAMAVLSTTDIMYRYVSEGQYQIWYSPSGQRAAAITDKHFQLFHRHKIDLLGENECPNEDHPCDTSLARLDGSLYSGRQGYDGPGVNVPTSVFSIGTYGTWTWGDSEASMWNHSNRWATWFGTHSPKTEYFLYLQDEPSAVDFAKNETWARWLRENPGPGKSLQSAVTKSPVIAKSEMPDVNIPIMPADTGACPYGQIICDNTTAGSEAANYYRNTPTYRYWAYNDGRPASGSTMTEDDGVAMRVLPWEQTKFGIERWFYWYVNPDGRTNLFQDAVTFGASSYRDYSTGEAGYLMSNGNGLLVYPGTDLFNPSDSYGLDGPIASVRLKEWRRGLQDADYLHLASQVNKTATDAIINRVLPKALWEYPAPDPNYASGAPTWSSDPDVWESARAELAGLISSGCLTHNHDLADSQTCSAPDGNGSNSQSEQNVSVLSINSSIPGTRVIVFGEGCPAGLHMLPLSLRVVTNSLCMLSVAAPEGFAFQGWNDGQNVNPRAFVVTSDTSLAVILAVSKRSTVPLSITASLPNAKVMMSGALCPISGVFQTPFTTSMSINSACTAEIIVPKGYRFTKWSNGLQTNPLDISVQDSGVTLNATVELIPTINEGIPSVTITTSSIGGSFYIFGSGCSSGFYTMPSTVNVTAGSLCSIFAAAPDGLIFDKWSDGQIQQSRAVVVGAGPIVLEAVFR